MKRWFALLCALCCLIGVCQAEEEVWTRKEWEKVAEDLASDVPNPVPVARRISVNPHALRSQKAEREENGWVNVLLLSTDAKQIEDNYGRTDAMMVCRVDLTTGDVRLLSLPEDALVTLEDVPEPIALRYVNCFGGPLLAVKTVNDTLDLQVNRYCAVSMEAFVAVVDELGGVTMELTENEAEALGLKAGKNQLNGMEALKFVKLRRQGDGDKRARALLEAAAHQTVDRQNVNSALRLPDLLIPAMDTNLTTDDLINLVFAMFGQETSGNVKTGALTAENGAQLGEEEAKACRSFLYGEGE